MSCYEDAMCEITKLEHVPEFKDEQWAVRLRAFLESHGFKVRFIPLDSPAIVSRRLPNGRVHAEAMYPTLITILERA